MNSGATAPAELALASACYVGRVTHKRLRPREHRLGYNVFTLLVALDELPHLPQRSWLFSHNRWNLLSIQDRDFGDRSGCSIAPQITALAAQIGVDLTGGRILMLCYPRVLGFAFNPITVYFCYEASGRLSCLVHEVSNTFGERHSYVLPVAENDGNTIYQRCDKAMFVSPFNTAQGGYTFHVKPPAERVAVGVLLRDADGPKLKALFEGGRRSFNDAVLARLLMAMPFQTLKVVGGIHWQALKLWWKRLPLLTKPAGRRYAASTPSATSATKSGETTPSRELTVSILPAMPAVELRPATTIG